MNNDGSGLWSQHFDSGEGGGITEAEEDFSSFLNLPDIPLDLSYDGPGNGGADGMAMDLTFSQSENMGSAVSMAESTNGARHGHGVDGMSGVQFHHDAQRNQFQGLGHAHDSYFGGAVPPTPTSMGPQGSSLHAFQQINHEGPMDFFGPYREDQMIFTPLVSPAVTPLEADFQHLPEFAMPGAMSPLASPALDAHQYSTSRLRSNQVRPGQAKALDNTGSPVITRKSDSRRKSVSSRDPVRGVRESPSMKPARKKAPSMLLAAPEQLADALATGMTSLAPTHRRRDSSFAPLPGHDTPMQFSSREASSNDSVSPEPLPDVLMAPPPPRNSKSTTPKDSSMGPVTPASLMKINNTLEVNAKDVPPINMDTSEFIHRDVQPAAKQADSPKGDEQTTPRLDAKRTPSLKPAPGSTSSSRKSSPQEKTPNMGPMNKMVDSGKGLRKRGSVSSSPALQPRISPSIKPLLPQGMSPDASTFLLASKSNYQNIVEGNHSQLGLQYPEHLSTNLTSKRTSHKIAEQGRRNRINQALGEISALLPTAARAASNGGESSGGSAAREQASKAATVEQAIVYIKQLKQELKEKDDALADTKEKLQVAEAKLQKQQSNTTLGT